jgi:hypothetical protein
MIIKENALLATFMALLLKLIGWIDDNGEFTLALPIAWQHYP